MYRKLDAFSDCLTIYITTDLVYRSCGLIKGETTALKLYIFVKKKEEKTIIYKYTFDLHI